MSRIEHVVREISELRSFYFKIKNRRKPPQDGNPSGAPAPHSRPARRMENAIETHRPEEE
jgi:hypothetical protein